MACVELSYRYMALQNLYAQNFEVIELWRCGSAQLSVPLDCRGEVGSGPGSMEE